GVKVPNPIVDIFENIGELVLLYAERTRRVRKTLELLYAGVGDSGQVCQFTCVACSALGKRNHGGGGTRNGRPDCRNRRNRSRRGCSECGNSSLGTRQALIQ